MAKKPKKPEFTPVNESDLNPSHRWHRPLQAPGITQVDFEERVNFQRLHRYRVARTRQSLANSDPRRDAVFRPAQHPLHLQHGHW